jgi:hypothetical protein
MAQKPNDEVRNQTGRMIQLVLALGILAPCVATLAPFLAPLLWSARGTGHRIPVEPRRSDRLPASRSLRQATIPAAAAGG